MSKKTDMRISKTTRAIKNAFKELITTKPVYRITVTELAEKAEISKGTFYLHYTDIFDLYNKLVKETVDKIAGSFDPYPAMFERPEDFVRTFMFAQVEPLGKDLTAGERALLLTENISFCPEYPQNFIDAFKERIYDVGRLERCGKNDMKIDFLLNGMLSIVIKYRHLTTDDEEMKEFVVGFVSASIRETFPEIFSQEK